MLGPHRLDEDKSFVCLSDECSSNTINVPRRTLEGSLIFHDCGNEAILTYDGRTWSLRAKDDAPAAPQIIDNRGEENMANELKDAVTGQFIKRKRGRPKKVQVAVEAQILSDEQRERDVNLMKGVEADCPHEVTSAEGQEWCAKEFDKRKANVEAQAPKSTKLAKAEPEFDKDFIKEAKASDSRIDKNLHRGSESFFEAVKDLIVSGEKGYYKALGFKNFNAYRESKSQYSRSHIGQGIQAYKALHARIPDDKLMTIPIPTAILLTKIPESRLTTEVIEAANTMKIQDFKEKEFPKHASLLADGSTGETQAQEIQVEEFAWITRIRVHQQVADRWKKLLEVARWKASGLVDEYDVAGNFDSTEKALICIYLECCKASGWEQEYNDWQGQQAGTTAATVDAEEAPAF